MCVQYCTPDIILWEMCVQSKCESVFSLLSYFCNTEKIYVQNKRETAFSLLIINKYYTRERS